MINYFLAVDIGASSGRHILGSVQNGVIRLEEVYRFENRLVTKNGYLCWDYNSIYKHIIQGLKKCKEIGKMPVTMGIDTWAVDYVLLDEEDKIIGETYAYRDGRTNDIDKEVAKLIDDKLLYNKTGIQKQQFNTIYQLYAHKKSNPKNFERAKHFLMVPEYLNFCLTGTKVNEYTNSTSTGLVNAKTKTWDYDIINALGLPKDIFGDIHEPETVVGRFNENIKNEVGFDCTVILPATHDTASAVLAVPTQDDNSIYISSGTWSLMGVENKEPITSEESRICNFTNEGGYKYRYRYLKNIMGLWIIQCVKRELDNKYSFAELADLAKKSENFNSVIDVNDNVFLAPESMITAIKEYCADNNQDVPSTIGELMQCIYRSLSISYAKTVDELKAITNKQYKTIHIVGGGSQDSYLNEMTTKACGISVLAGPTEGTALGNLIVQMIYTNEFEDLFSARKAIINSFLIKKWVV